MVFTLVTQSWTPQLTIRDMWTYQHCVFCPKNMHCLMVYPVFSVALIDKCNTNFDFLGCPTWGG